MGEFDVELRNVTKYFGDFKAVDDVSLAVRKGEFLTLLGPSGCGKSTTLRMIAGFIHPSIGDILIAGKVMGTRPPYKRDSSMVFQDYALFPHLDVFENVAFGLRERRESTATIREKVGRMLEIVGLGGLARRKPAELSGGQRQRVALARSLVLEPTVLLLDEPLGALDLKMRQHMQVELKNLQHRVGVSFIYVTHDQEEALVMSDRIAVMNEGRLEQIGSSREVYERPRTRFVADFIGETNLLEAKVETIAGGSARVRCRSLEIHTLVDGHVREGDTVHVSIRPEKLVSGEEAARCPTRCRGVVTDVVYKGSIIRYELRVADDLRLLYDEQTKYQPVPHNLHEEVQLGCLPEDVIVIRH
jgi:spermidine/putrescine transport system ATP-binding protein